MVKVVLDTSVNEDVAQLQIAMHIALLSHVAQCRTDIHHEAHIGPIEGRTFGQSFAAMCKVCMKVTEVQRHHYHLESIDCLEKPYDVDTSLQVNHGSHFLGKHLGARAGNGNSALAIAFSRDKNLRPQKHYIWRHVRIQKLH